MKSVGGLWIPDDEEYLAEKLEGIPDYLLHYDQDMLARVRALKNRRIALDVGANVGIWSMKLAMLFDYVHAFEPLDEVRECWHRNVRDVPATVWEYALGDREGMVRLNRSDTGAGTGDKRATTFKTYVKGDGNTRMMRLDYWVENELRPDVHIDFIKIDCEGFDFYVLQGGEQTILKHKPAILFEDKKGVSLKRYRLPQYTPLMWLKNRGYTMTHHDNGNFFMEPTTWPSLALST